VQTVVIGDIRDIRRSAKYNKVANQKIHQMSSGKLRQMLTYKAERLGMQVVLQEERYTSQKCPRCNRLNKPGGREYHCRA
jgi:putative transposase